VFVIAAALASPPTPEDVVGCAHVLPPVLEPDGETVRFTVGRWAFDPDAEPLGDTQAGWSWRSEELEVDTRTGQAELVGQREGWSHTVAPDGTVAWVGRDGNGGASVFVAPPGEEAHALDVGGRWPSGLTISTDGAALYFLARTPASEAARQAAWWAGGVREHDAPRRTPRLHRLELASGTVEALTPEHLHVEDFALGPDGAVAVTTAATSRDYDAYFISSKASSCR